MWRCAADAAHTRLVHPKAHEDLSLLLFFLFTFLVLVEQTTASRPTQGYLFSRAPCAGPKYFSWRSTRQDCQTTREERKLTLVVVVQVFWSSWGERFPRKTRVDDKINAVSLLVGVSSPKKTRTLPNCSASVRCCNILNPQPREIR